ncbi:hypothetical protein HYF16_000256 [Salmonella enterica]|nr:hypothetical protein [Salmonella enterica]
MLIYPAVDLSFQGKRTQPWDKTTGHQYRPGQYYNFRENPGLIETSLEDFIEHSDQQAIKTFFSLLTWINGDSSALESTDCMFSGTPKVSNVSAIFDCTHSSSGRLEFFLRDIWLNKKEAAIRWMLYKLSLYLQIERPDFRKETFGIVPLVTEYITGDANKHSGHRVCIYFDAHGNGIDDVWHSLEIMFSGLTKALKRMNVEMISGKSEPIPVKHDKHQL